MRQLTLAVALAGLLSGPVAAANFNPGCTLPFKPIQVKHPTIDDGTCGLEGTFKKAAEDTPEHRAQNRAKNNFCASGDPLTLTFNDFEKLQTAAENAHVTFGARDTLPTDRSVLVNLMDDGAGGKVGEGRLVRLVGFIIDTKAGSSESVNCNRTKIVNNDIHIALGKDPNDDECDGVIAEISPHFRPKDWNRTNLNALTRRPVRITGQLFFDASHLPCHNGKPKQGDPRRMSIWEIHPVYAVDVCIERKLTSCKIDDDDKWLPLNEWDTRAPEID